MTDERYCGLPGINLQSLNQTLNYTSSWISYFLNPCDQIRNEWLKGATACLEPLPGYYVAACETMPPRMYSMIAQNPVDQISRLFTETESPRGVLISFNQTTPCGPAQSLNQSMTDLLLPPANVSLDIQVECRRDYAEPFLNRPTQWDACLHEATIYSVDACRCGVPGVDFYEFDRLLSSQSPQDPNTTYIFSPCHSIPESMCKDLISDEPQAVCMTYNDGRPIAVMPYIPETAKWFANVSDGITLVTSITKANDPRIPWAKKIFTANYWCNQTAIEPFISNVFSEVIMDNILIIDVQTHRACLPLPPKPEPVVSQAHVIVVIVFCALLLICVALLCKRARSHVDRWAYVDGYADDEFVEPNEPEFPQRRVIQEVEIFQPEYRRLE